MCLSPWIFSSYRTIKTMKGGSEIISVDSRREIVFTLWKSHVVARFPYYRHDDVKSGWTHWKRSQMRPVKCQPVPPLLSPSSIHPSLAGSLSDSALPSLSSSLSPVIRVRSWITHTVIYRPGFPRELLAPPGIHALRQNPMHVYSQFISNWVCTLIYNFMLNLQFKHSEQTST